MNDEASSHEPVLYRAKRRVTLRDTDASGLIHYAVAMEWTEAFFTEWLLALGHPISQMLSSGEATPVVRVEADYRAPIGVDDILEMRLSTAHLGDKSFSLWVRAHDIAGSAVLEVHVFHVYTLFEKSPLSPRPKTTSAPLPEWLRSALSVPIKS